MNPYAQFFSNPSDVAIVWLVVAGWLVIGSALARKRFATISIHSERVCSAVALAFFSLELTIMLIFAIGLIFLVWLKTTSVFWAFWKLGFFMSVICVFTVLPILAIGLFCWSFIGRQRANYSSRNLYLSLICLVTTLIDGALYFLF
jgi:hypothetical protein